MQRCLADQPGSPIPGIPVQDEDWPKGFLSILLQEKASAGRKKADSYGTQQRLL